MDRQNDRQRNKYTHNAWAGGTFFSCAVVSVFQFWREIVFGVTLYLSTVFWVWREIVFGVTYILRVQYSCVLCQFFWSWQEIVLKMRTSFDFLGAVSTKKNEKMF
jgi:hypothetical protein